MQSLKNIFIKKKEKTHWEQRLEAYDVFVLINPLIYDSLAGEKPPKYINLLRLLPVFLQILTLTILG